MTRVVVADDVAWVSRAELDEGDVQVAYVTTLPHGPAVVLRGSACLVWLVVIEGGIGGVTVDEAAAAAAELADLPVTDVVADVEALLTELVAAGLLRGH